MFFRRRLAVLLFTEAGLANSFVLLAMICALAIAASPARAVDRTWTGGSAWNWSDPGSWDPQGVPQSQDILYFGGSGGTINFDVPSQTVAGLVFESGDYAVGEAAPPNTPNSDPRFGQLTVVGPSGQGGWITNCGGNSRTVTFNIQTLSFPNGGYISSGAGDDGGLFGSATIDLNLNCGIYVSNQLEIHAQTHIFESDLETHVDGGTTTFNGIYYQSIDGFDFGTIAGPGSLLAACDYGSSLSLSGPPYQNEGGMTVQTQIGASVDLAMYNLSRSNYSLTIDNASVVKLAAGNQLQMTDVYLFGGAQLLLDGNDTYVGSLSMVDYVNDAYGCVVDTGTAVLDVQGNIYSSSDNETVYPIIKGTVYLPGLCTVDTEGTAYYGLDMQGQLTGSAGVLKKTGPTAMFLDGSNTCYQIDVSGGTVEARNNFAFGLDYVWLSGGSLILDNLAIANGLSTYSPTGNDSDSGVVTHGPCSCSGEIYLGESLFVYSDNSFQISGPIQGSGDLLLFGETVELAGDSPNTATGSTVANCSLLTLNKAAPSQTVAVGGPLVVGSQGGSLTEVRWLNNSQINSNAAAVTIYAGGLMNLNGYQDAVGSINFNGGTVANSGNGILELFQGVTANPGHAPAFIQGGTLALAAGPVPFDIEPGPSEPELSISSSIVGLGGIAKTGDGELLLSGANSFDGQVLIGAGTVDAASDTALGGAVAGTIVSNGATLTVDAAGLPTPLTIQGNGRGGTNGALCLLPFAGVAANITLAGTSTVEIDSGTGYLTGVIGGVGSLIKTGAGTLQLGNGAGNGNTYDGDTFVDGGALALFKPTGVNAVPGNLIIGSFGFGGGPAIAQNLNSFQIVGSVTVNGASLWNLGGYAESFDTNMLQDAPPLTLAGGGSVTTGSGILYLPVGGNVVVNPFELLSFAAAISGNIGLDPGPHQFIVSKGITYNPAPDLTVSANISQTSTAAEVIKTSLGVMSLTGTNSYTGSTLVSNGTLEINGYQPQSTVQVVSGMFQGNGTVGPLQTSGSSSIVTAAVTPSILYCGGFNGTTAHSGTLQVTLNGTQPGSGYSQLEASGPITLSKLNLAATLNFSSSYSDQFTIIKNDGAGPVTGTFAGLAEGASLTISGEPFNISYVGGSGKDVVLTHLSPATISGTYHWTNVSGGIWNVAANWDAQAVPNGVNASIALTTACVISNNAAATLAELFYSSPLCTIGGSGSFSMSGLFDWQGGSFNGSGSLFANGGLHLASSGAGGLNLQGMSLINSAGATWSANTALTLTGGSILSNTVTGTFDCAADGAIQNGPGTNLVANAGSFRKTAGGGASIISVPFQNSGMVDVQTGSVNLAGGGNSSGNFNIAAGATLAISAGTHTIEPTATIGGAGEFQVTGGTANLFGSISTLGAHTFTGGIVNVGDNYNATNNDISIGACTVNFVGLTPVTAASLTLGGYGFLGGSNVVEVSGLLTWNGSFTITGSNSLIADGGLTISQGGDLFGRTLLNMDSGVWTNNGIGTLEFGSGAVFSNAPGATFDCVGNSIIEQTAGGGTVANAGLFRIIGPPATITIEVPFNNSGTLEVQSGLLSLSGGGMNTGVINVFSNATLSLGSGFSLAPGASITGAGQLLVPFSTAAANLAGTVNLTGSNVFSGGVANLTGNYICSNIALTVEAGTVNFNTSNVISPATLTVGGYGSLGGSNMVTISGPMIWNSGFTITGSNSVIANGGLTIGPGSVTLDGRTLVNMALGLWTNNGAGTLELIDGAVLSNAPEATFDCVGNGTIEASTGGGLVANAGLFQTVGVPATNIIQAPFSNNAVVEVQSGTLSLGEGGSSIAPSNSVAEIDVFSNATIDFRGGTFLLDPAAIIDGPGTLSVSGGTANLEGAVDLQGSHSFTGGVANLTGFYNCVSNALLISGGTANFNGSGVIAPTSLVLGIYGTLGGSNLVSVNGAMTWGGSSTITGANSVIANGGLTIGPGNVSLSGRALVNTGPALWTNNGPGDILLYDGALLSNAPSGTFDCLGNGVIDFSSGGGVLANAGLFEIIGAGAATTIEVPFTNNGTVEVDSGTLSFSAAPYTQTAGLTLLNGGNISNSTPLQILGGELTGNGLISGSLTNAAFLHPGAPFGQMTVGGAFTQTAAGTLDITLAGPIPGAGFNSLIVGTTAQLGGVLAVSFSNSFEPPIGSRFQILSCAGCSGVFSALYAPAGISVNYSSNAVFLAVTGAVLTPALLQSPQLSGGNLSFSFQTASNQSYTIQQNSDVSKTNWFMVTNFTGDGSLFQFLIPLTTGSPQNFFRVRQP